jgi:hypothetical protein
VGTIWRLRHVAALLRFEPVLLRLDAVVLDAVVLDAVLPDAVFLDAVFLRLTYAFLARVFFFADTAAAPLQSSAKKTATMTRYTNFRMEILV